MTARHETVQGERATPGGSAGTTGEAGETQWGGILGPFCCELCTLYRMCFYQKV